MGQAEVAATLARLGDRRYLEKVAIQRQALQDTDAETLLYRGLVEAMGYGGDRDAFRRLASALPWAWLQQAMVASTWSERVEVAEAILFGAAGFLNGETEGECPESLQRRWRSLDTFELGQEMIWRVQITRPGNSPQRRLAGLARLLARYVESSLIRGLRDVVFAGTSQALVEAITVPADGYWRGHIDLFGRRWEGAPALIGKGRAIEIATNAVLPVLGAWGELSGELDLADAALATYRRLPRPANYGSVAFLKANLEGKTTSRASHQQALLYLLENYCSRGGCGRCPLS